MDMLGYEAAMSATRRSVLSARPDAPVQPERPRRVRGATARVLRRVADRLEPAHRLEPADRLEPAHRHEPVDRLEPGTTGRRAARRTPAVADCP